ncbi:pilus assembly protein TadG-related protein [Streptomyces sp. NPDC049597]|uniref:pilus assembly protein TadG-related protein n=1 Tax=Streptomyces sp. NPDC049597 TaxID=3155276 RepID=UPI003435FBE9
MAERSTKDQGQAFPIYVVMVGSLLFLAFAFFAVGQASATRNTAQGAADAAALAAAQDAREKLSAEWLDSLADPTRWQDIFDGKADITASCGAAAQFAAKNGAVLDGERCYSTFEPWGLTFTADVRTQKPIGDSIIPGTESEYATADAKAAVKPRCTFELADDAQVLPTLTCKTKSWDLEDDPTDLPDAKDLFDVQLVD